MKAIKELENRSENQVNNKHKFEKILKNKRYQLVCKKVKQKYHYERKIKPEFSEKKQDSFISVNIWDKLWPIIKNMHWKVQNGLVFWFAIQVNDHPWEKKVLNLLEKLKIENAHSKKACTKVFSLISIFFRKLRDVSLLFGYKGK